MDLSIIIPVYNALPLLERTLNSIYGQKTKYDFEVILVDDGSTDGSVDFIHQYIEKDTRGNIVLLKQENAGPAKARNNGIVHAKGRFSAFLDADDYWENGFIEKTLDFLYSHNECVAVSVGQRHLTLSGDDISPSCINDYNESFILEDFWSFWGTYMHVCTGSVCLKTDVIKKIGGQRIDLRVTEDLEFWALVSTYGRWGLIPELLFVSDGTDLVNTQQAWISKMSPRWNNAPSLEVWQQRILNRFQDLGYVELPEGFLIARGRVAESLVYCKIMSGRKVLARKETKQYGNYFRKGLILNIERFCSKNIFLWNCFCSLLIYHEHHRF